MTTPVKKARRTERGTGDRFIPGDQGHGQTDRGSGNEAIVWDPATMASRKCRGLYLVGEILDVDGRIGGFNFQWAWSTGWVAGAALVAEPQPSRLIP